MSKRSSLLAAWQKLTVAFNGLQAGITSVATMSRMIGDLYNDAGLKIQENEKSNKLIMKEITEIRLELKELKKSLPKDKTEKPKQEKKVKI